MLTWFTNGIQRKHMIKNQNQNQTLPIFSELEYDSPHKLYFTQKTAFLIKHSSVKNSL